MTEATLDNAEANGTMRFARKCSVYLDQRRGRGQ